MPSKDDMATSPLEMPADVAALREDYQRLRELLDLIPDYVYVMDYEGRMRMVNRAVGDGLGLPREKIVGRRFSDLDPDSQQGREIVRRAQETIDIGTPLITVEMPFKRADGREQVLRLHEIPFVDPVRGDRVLLGIATDITAQKQLDRERMERERIAQELGLAREIQSGLLPDTPPELERFEVAGWSAPAEETGGDGYDWMTQPDGRTVVTLADATGHGIGPALLMAGCRAYARATLGLPGELAAQIGQLNKHLCHELRDGRFVTFAAAALDDADGTIELVSAGQGPIFRLIAAEDQIEPVSAHGLPLGVVCSEEFESTGRQRYAPGDLLVIASDGLFEASNAAHELFGAERFAELVRKHAHESPAELITTLRGAVEAHAHGTPPTDDRTLVVVRCRG